MSKPLITYINLAALDLDESIPTMDDFKQAWSTLDNAEKEAASAMLKSETFAGYATHMENYSVNSTAAASKRMTVNVIKAYYFATASRMQSPQARETYVKTVVGQQFDIGKRTSLQAVATHNDNLIAMADKLEVDGDGKRGILKQLIAYGLQTKELEPEVRDTSNNLLSPPVYALADAKMAYAAVQELNRMDHEYGQDDKATSSIEGQAERVRRLAEMVAKQARPPAPPHARTH